VGQPQPKKNRIRALRGRGSCLAFLAILSLPRISLSFRCFQSRFPLVASRVPTTPVFATSVIITSFIQRADPCLMNSSLPLLLELPPPLPGLLSPTPSPPTFTNSLLLLLPLPLHLSPYPPHYILCPAISVVAISALSISVLPSPAELLHTSPPPQPTCLTLLLYLSPLLCYLLTSLQPHQLFINRYPRRPRTFVAFVPGKWGWDGQRKRNCTT
jgi:hypothetical protein